MARFREAVIPIIRSCL